MLETEAPLAHATVIADAALVTQKGPATLAASASDVKRLEESFRVFTRMTHDLERAFDKLTERSSRVDHELGRTNKKLLSKLAELESLSSNRRRILEALPNGVVVVDEAGFIETVNPAAERLLGRCAQELCGRHRQALVGPTGDCLLLDSAAQAVEGGAIEREVVVLDGCNRRLSITRAPLPGGSEIQVLVDLTVVTRLREQVNRLDTLANLGEMAAGIAHEIRNPLNGIAGFAGLLQRSVGGDDPTAQRYVKNISRGVREVNDIITNLLTFASPGRAPEATVVLSELLKDVEATAQGFLESRPKVELNLVIHPAARRIAIRGDATKLKIVFTNLVKNAIEAIADRGSVTVRLELSPEGREARIKVTDTGSGVPAAMRHRVFQPFATTKAQGTGLGLALAHRFVELHGGSIRCDNVAEGCTFSIELPLCTREESMQA